MIDHTRAEALKIEEIKATKLYLYLFYFMYFGYDFIYYYVLPLFIERKMGVPDEGLSYFPYLFHLLLLLVAYYFTKKGNPFSIKYIYFFSFLILDFINSILRYWGTSNEFKTGNIVEILIVLFAPLFVNKGYFWLVSIGMILKYIVYGLLFKSPSLILPVVLLLFFSIVGYILLTRFNSYINGMIKAYENSRQKENLAVIGQMAASIAHEIRNPLSALKGFTQLQQEKDMSKDNFYPIMLNEIDRINMIVSDLLIIGKPNGSTRNKAEIGNIIHYVVSIIKPQAVRQGVKIHIQKDPDLPPILCDENQLKQVFINLLKNAVEAMPDGGNIYIKVQAAKDSLVVSIKDEGVGIPGDKIEKLGEPFYTTKENGTGLGFMVTKKIIEEHGGKIAVQSVKNKGATVDVSLPAGPIAASNHI
ncbi:GHKL domain-containing protein [Mesobacillus foraminis]|uniref:ATP-binding protein n=1 Tax=Mesobacillus foraminis TaxID=279826 RepID=UPI001BE86C43|nr:ATP-binding protein [Mesobacillus foraminis]MBT2758388.1 GHKL domain-containing protein [Mesobacillus foraminis]